MPRIKRWFPVSQDVNSDPETWQLTEEFGDRALRVWLEMLSVGDRNEGFVGHDSPQLYAIFAAKCRVYSPKVRSIFAWCFDRGWLINRDGFRIANFAKYHRTPERKPVPSEPSEPSEPNFPNQNASKIPLKRQKPKTPYPDDFQISDQLRDWCHAQNVSDPDSHLEAFRDYHIARGSRFIDWSAAFRTWLRNSQRFPQAVPKQKEGELSDRTMRILRRGL